MQERCGLLDIELKNTSLKFWKCFSSGKLETSLNISDLLEVLREAEKYLTPVVVDQCLEEIKKQINQQNVQTLKTYGEDIFSFSLIKLCDSWIDRNNGAIRVEL
jgi:hypothetical protein